MSWSVDARGCPSLSRVNLNTYTSCTYADASLSPTTHCALSLSHFPCPPCASVAVPSPGLALVGRLGVVRRRAAAAGAVRSACAQWVPPRARAAGASPCHQLELEHPVSIQSATGQHRRREEAALHRRAIARGEHLVALLEEPELEQLVCFVQHQVLEGRERQRALAQQRHQPHAACTPSRRTGATRRWTRRRHSRRRRHRRRRRRCRARRERTRPPRDSW